MISRTISRMYHTAIRIKAQHGYISLLKATLTEFVPILAKYIHDKPEINLAKDFTNLYFTPARKPLVSIIIAVHNHSFYTYNCLRSILNTRTKSSYEIIVINDCSTDNTEEVLNNVSGIKVINNKENIGFLLSCNKAAKITDSQFIVLLNNDTLVTDHWLDNLVEAMLLDKFNGLVGSKLIYPNGCLQEAGGLIFRDASGCNYGNKANPKHPDYCYLRAVDYCSGASVIINNSLFKQLRGFDERYIPAYYEDTDLSFQIREAGYNVLYQPHSTVVHFEGISNGQNLNTGIKQYQKNNRKKFAKKWTNCLTTKDAPTAFPDIHTLNNNNTKRILIMDSKVPTPSKDSGSFRMNQIIEILLDLGYQITLLPGDLMGHSDEAKKLQQKGVHIIYAPFYSVKGYLKKFGKRYQTIFIARATIAQRYLKFASKYAPSSKLIFDTVDIHHIREEREAKLSNNYLKTLLASIRKKNELSLISQSDITFVVSTFEKNYLSEILPEKDIRILSNIHTIHDCKNLFDSRKDMLFIGSFEHPPNVDAMKYFVSEIFPLVKNKDIKLIIIGSLVPDEILNLANDRIIVKGFVDDLNPILDNIKFSIAPLRYGAGVKGKINLSMSHGIPVIVTSVAAEGMFLKHKENSLIADKPSAFAKNIDKLNLDKELWKHISQRCHQNIENHFSINNARKAIKRAL